MEDTHVYSNQEIEKLRKKIMTYRQTLMDLQNGQTVEEPLFSTYEVEMGQIQNTKVDGNMEAVGETETDPLYVYDQQIKDFSREMEVLNEKVQVLNQDLSEVVNRFKEGEEVSPPVMMNKLAHVLKTKKGNERTDSIAKAQTPTSSNLNTTHFSSFTQLNRLIKHATTIEEGPNDVKRIENLPNKMGEIEGRQHHKVFPWIESSPSQRSKGLYGKVRMKSPTRFQKIELQQEFLINISQPLNQHAIPTGDESAQQETYEVHFEEDFLKTPSVMEESVQVELVSQQQLDAEFIDEKRVASELLEEASDDMALCGMVPVSTGLLKEAEVEIEAVEGNQLTSELVNKEIVELTPLEVEENSYGLLGEELVKIESVEAQQIEEVMVSEEPLEGLGDLEQQEHKPKPMLSLFSFFRKKN